MQYGTPNGTAKRMVRRVPVNDSAVYDDLNGSTRVTKSNGAIGRRRTVNDSSYYVDGANYTTSEPRYSNVVGRRVINDIETTP